MPTYAATSAERIALQWGLDLADATKLPIYVTTTVGKASIYLELGFKRENDIVLDLARFGGEGEYRMAALVRRPEISSCESNF